MSTFWWFPPVILALLLPLHIFYWSGETYPTYFTTTGPGIIQVVAVNPAASFWETAFFFIFNLLASALLSPFSLVLSLLLCLASSPLRSFVLFPIEFLKRSDPRHVRPNDKQDVRQDSVAEQSTDEVSTNPDPVVFLHDGPNAVVDVVAVHGLGSRSDTTWIHKRTGKNWLKDFLPDDIPPARIMTFRHNSQWKRNSLDKNLPEHGQQLLDGLLRSRSREETRERPLLLIGYSFGGLLIKQTLVLAKEFKKDEEECRTRQKLANSLAGVIFLGTPHAGSCYTSLGKILARLLYWNGADDQLLEYVEHNSKKARDLENKFLEAYGDLRTMDYVESKRNTIVGLPAGLVVSKFSATRPGRPSEMLDVNHFELNNFDCKNDASYVSIKTKIGAIIDEKLRANEEQAEKEVQRYRQFLDTLGRGLPRMPVASPGPAVSDIYQRDEFQRWQSGKPQVLWVFCNPEQNIADFIRRDAEAIGEIVMYFTFQSDDRFISLEHFYPVILHQLLEGILYKKISLRHDCFEVAHKQRAEGSSSWHQVALREILSKLPPPLLVIDSVDECDSSTRITELRNWLSDISGLPNLRTLLTSNRDKSIESLAREAFLQLFLEDEIDKPAPQPDSIGIKVWDDPPNAIVDVCFVHGLSGDRSSTWTAADKTEPWPKELLPGRLDRARILTYGYDVYVARGSAHDNDRLNDLGQTFLAKLTAEREGTETLTRPIIFVAHCLGGLLCKEAILLSHHAADSHLENIVLCVKGIIFMGTPHQGSWISDWKAIRAKKLGIRKFPNKSLVAILATDNECLEKLQQDFGSLIRKLGSGRDGRDKVEISCYYETETPPHLDKRIVSKVSATFLNYPRFSIKADHSGMAKFSSGMDTSFILLAADLQRWIKQLVNASIKRNEEDRHFLSSLKPIDQRAEKAGIEASAGGLLRDAYTWILENEEFLQWSKEESSRLLWIKGDPGKGKTMLLCGIIDHLGARVPRPSVSFFFCQEANQKTNHASAVLRGLIYMLLETQPTLIYDTRQKHQQWLDSDGVSFFTLQRMLKEILEHPRLQEAYLIVDALDECTTDLPLLLNLIEEFSQNPKIKWLVSSRNVYSVEEQLGASRQQKETLSLELNQDSISAAVATYIRMRVEDLAKSKRHDPATQKEIHDYLLKNADNTFLWVALVCKQLKNEPIRHTTKMREFPKGLVPLYQRMIGQVCSSENARLCEPVLRYRTLVYEPITLAELMVISSDLEDSNHDELRIVVQLCGSFLTMRGNKIYFVHQSAKDFLVSKDCALMGSANEQATVHQAIFERSVSRMGDILEYNMCDIRAGTTIDDIETLQMDENLSSIRYSSIFWIEHLCEISKILKKSSVSREVYHYNENGQVMEFLTSHFLHWIEYLSLTKSTSEGFLEILRLNTAVLNNNPQLNLLGNASSSRSITHQESDQRTEAPFGLREFLKDGEMFWFRNKTVIDTAPLQTYGGALVFHPLETPIRKLFWEQRLPMIREVEGAADNWDSLLQSFIATGDICATAFPGDWGRIAVGSADGEIQIWNFIFGIPEVRRSDFIGRKGEFYGLDYKYQPIAFSPRDENRIAYQSCEDCSISIWDLKSNSVAKFFWASSSQHSRLDMLQFSPDGTTVALSLSSGMFGGDIILLDIESGAFRPLKCGFRVLCLAFTDDSETLVLSSSSGEVQAWKIGDKPVRRLRIDHTRSSCEVGRYPSKYVCIFISNDKSVMLVDSAGDLWSLDMKQRQIHRQEFEGDEDFKNLVKKDFKMIFEDNIPEVFVLVSHGKDKVLIAILSRLHNKIIVWDFTEGGFRYLDGLDTTFAKGMAISPDGEWLATYEGNTFKLWSVSNSFLLDPSNTIWDYNPYYCHARSLALSPDGKKYAFSCAYFKSWHSPSHIDEMHRSGLPPPSPPPPPPPPPPFPPPPPPSRPLKINFQICETATDMNLESFIGLGGCQTIVFSPNGSLLAKIWNQTEVDIWGFKNGLWGRVAKFSESRYLHPKACVFLDETKLAMAVRILKGYVVIIWDFVNKRYDALPADIQRLPRSYLPHEGWLAGKESLRERKRPCVFVHNDPRRVTGVNWGPLLDEIDHLGKARFRQAGRVVVWNNEAGNRTWINVDGYNVLCLPAVPKVTSSAVYENILFLSLDSGKVARLILGISPNRTWLSSYMLYTHPLREFWEKADMYAGDGGPRKARKAR